MQAHARVKSCSNVVHVVFRYGCSHRYILRSLTQRVRKRDPLSSKQSWKHHVLERFVNPVPSSFSHGFVARSSSPLGGRRLRVNQVQLQARLHKHLQLRAHALATAHRDRQVAHRDQDRRPAQIAGTQHEVLHFNVSSATDKTAWPQMLGVTVDFIDCDTGMAGVYNHKRLRTPKSLEFAATADRCQPLGGMIGEGGGSHPDSGSPDPNR